MGDRDPAAPRVRPGVAPVRVWTLGSGSRGNAVLVEHAGRYVMLDAGYELPELVERLRAAGVAPALVDDVVLTHGHRDHVIGAAAGAGVYGWRVWATLGTVWRWRALREVPVRPFAPGDSFDAGPFRVHTAATPHDVDDASALVVEVPDAGVRVGYLTDLGHVPAPVARLAEGLDLLVLESNHDPELLANGPYPPDVKLRVAGPDGHLANAQAAALLGQVGHAGLRAVLLAHVSRHNNRPALALAAAREALQRTAFRGLLAVAPQDRVDGPYELPPGPARDRPDAGEADTSPRRTRPA